MTSPTLQFKRGLFVNLPALRAGEPGFTTDKNDLYIGIGAGTTASNQFYGSSRYWKREDDQLSLSAELKLVDAQAGGLTGVSLRSPTNAGAGVTYTLPGPGGTNGYYLRLAANDTLEWASVTDGVTFSNASFSGITTISHIDGTTADFSGIATAGSFYVDSTKVLSTEGGLVSLSGISTIDATTKATLESILSIDPNDFNSLNVTGIATVGGAFYANGDVTLGDAAGDTVTVKGTATFEQTITGTATTAQTLQTARDISVSGIVTGTASFDGSQNITIATTLQNDVVGLGTHTYGDYVASVTAGNGLTGDGSGEGSTPTLSVNVGAGITITSDNVELRNAGNLSDNTLQKWDDANEQLVNTIITDNGTTATVGGNLTVTGDLTVNGTSTVVNTTELTVYDRTITLGIQTGTTPSDTSWDLGVLMNYGDAGVAKTAGVIWEYGNERFQFASNADNPAVGVSTTTPNITVATFAPIEIGELWVNNACTGGAQQVITCENSELHLKNIVIDAGQFV